MRRKCSEATTQGGSQEFEVYNSNDKQALQRCDTHEQEGGTKPTPKQLKLSPSPSGGEGASSSKGKRPSDRTRNYLLAQSKPKAKNAEKKSPCKVKKPVLKRSKQLERLKTLKYEEPTKKKSTANGKTASQADSAGVAQPAAPSALALAPKAKAKAKAKAASEENKSDAGDEDLTKFSHKMYMRFWRSMNQCHFVRTKYLRHTCIFYLNKINASFKLIHIYIYVYIHYKTEF